MAWDWGAAAGAAIDILQGQRPGGQLPFVQTSAPQSETVTVNTRTGEVKPCAKRRRRRRLLTASDLSDLASLKAIVGGGAAMNAAVVKAVRR